MRGSNCCGGLVIASSFPAFRKAWENGNAELLSRWCSEGIRVRQKDWVIRQLKTIYVCRWQSQSLCKAALPSRCAQLCSSRCARGTACRAELWVCAVFSGIYPLSLVSDFRSSPLGTEIISLFDILWEWVCVCRALNLCSSVREFWEVLLLGTAVLGLCLLPTGNGLNLELVHPLLSFCLSYCYWLSQIRARYVYIYGYICIKNK